MPLSISPQLLDTSIRTSKNTFLRGVYSVVTRYNALPANTDKATRAQHLQVLTRLVGEYLTSKSPQPLHKGKGKSANRWDGFVSLLEQVGPEAQKYGLRLMTGPNDFREIGRQGPSYWLEFLDPLHRAGHFHTAFWTQWIENESVKRDRISYWKWLGHLPTDKSVAYLNAQDSERYRCVFSADNKLLDYMSGRPFHTQYLSTHFSGDGWAIFVCSPTGDLYAGSHTVNEFHHSSFLGGRPVMAAGELVVCFGEVVVITAKSGHYKPSASDMFNLVTRFPQFPSSALIVTDLHTWRCYRVGQFRRFGMKAPTVSKQEMYDKLPATAKNDKLDHVLKQMRD